MGDRGLATRVLTLTMHFEKRSGQRLTNLHHDLAILVKPIRLPTGILHLIAQRHLQPMVHGGDLALTQVHKGLVSTYALMTGPILKFNSSNWAEAQRLI